MEIKRIALVMDRLVGFNHHVLQGVRDFASARRAWICHFADPRPDSLPLLRDWAPHGMVVFLLNRDTESMVAELGLPAVDVANWLDSPSIPRVSVDDEAIGRLAAEYLIELG